MLSMKTKILLVKYKKKFRKNVNMRASEKFYKLAFPRDDANGFFGKKVRYNTNFVQILHSQYRIALLSF